MSYMSSPHFEYVFSYSFVGSPKCLEVRKLLLHSIMRSINVDRTLFEAEML